MDIFYIVMAKVGLGNQPLATVNRWINKTIDAKVDTCAKIVARHRAWYRRQLTPPLRTRANKLSPTTGHDVAKRLTPLAGTAISAHTANTNPQLTGGYIMKQIGTLVEIPKELTKLAAELMDLTPLVETIIFGAYMDHMNGCIGTYCPEMKTVYIDMGNALNENALYNSGMMFIPNVWYALIWALAHEVEHACQLELDPKLIEYNKLPQEYEDMATQSGSDLVLDWSEKNTVPKLQDLGWLGKQLIVMLNAMYSQHPEVADEATHITLGAAASLEAVFANHEFTNKGKEVLIQDIDAGKIGLKIGNDRFLTAYEFLGL